MKITLATKKIITRNSSPLFIAEIGSNHNGSTVLARKLLVKAKSAGADFVKFQSWSTSSIFSKVKYRENFFLNDDYRDRSDTSLKKIVSKYSISEKQLILLNELSKKIGISLISTPFSNKEVDFIVKRLKVPCIKIASMDLNNYPFIDYIARQKKPIILSIGMGTLQEIDKAIRIIENRNNKNIVILHCLSIYPAPLAKINLERIETLKKNYSYPVGFSDHSIGSSVSIAAIAKGATLIEKHFTLDKNMEGWDHKLSADPKEMKNLIQDCKNAKLALGNPRIIRTESKARVNEFRRSIVASRDIKKGEIFALDMLDFKRPGRGLSPGDIEFVIGKKSKRNISYDEIIKKEDF